MTTKSDINLTPCESSNVKGYGYDAASRTLGVQFKAGGPVYRYADVPPEVADGLASAESKGKFFATEIRNKFEHSKPERNPQEQA